MNALTLALAVLVSAAQAHAAPATQVPPGARVVDRLAATVNGEPVTLAEVEERAGSDYERAQGLPPGEERDRARARALKAAFGQIVDEKLFETQTSALGVDVSDAQVDAAIDDIKRREHFSDAQLDEALKQQGMDRASFRKAVKKQLEAYHILQAKVQSRVKVTDDDLRNYYQSHQRDFAADEEVRLRDIFLPVPAGTAPAEEAKIRAEAERIVAKLRGGADFATLARQVSKAPSAEDGGDLGFLKRGTVHKDLERVAFRLDKGQIGGPVRTPPGYHVVKVEDRRASTPKPFDEVKEQIRDRLTNEQLETYRGQFVAELRKDADIDVKIPELR